MIKKTTKQAYHYIPLVGILAAAVVGFKVFSYDQSFKIIISVAAAASYVVWGVVHHYIHDDLHLSVVLEYIVVAVLGLTVLLSLILSP